MRAFFALLRVIFGPATQCGACYLLVGPFSPVLSAYIGPFFAGLASPTDDRMTCGVDEYAIVVWRRARRMKDACATLNLEPCAFLGVNADLTPPILILILILHP